jgi:4-amino-4-deoxy-L-arabinose transferase-like glycosyltransferase
MLRKAYTAVLRFFEKYYPVFFAAACLTLAFYCFRCLDVQYVDSWDEARHGVNAYEMIQNGDYIRHTYNYQVDDWNLKPSISYWGIVLGFRLFGYSVFGLRFTSALAYLLTGIAAALFAKRYSKEASILVLGFFCANARPLAAHLARSGDADSLYLLFFTLAMLAMFRIHGDKKKLYVCGLMFSLAFLTKSWHAGMIAAIGGGYLLLTGEIFRLKLKEWGYFLLSVFAPLFMWFGWRYTKDGFTFLRQMVETDLLARTGSSNFEGHEFPFSFYYDTVFGNEAYIYRWLILICMIGGAVSLFFMWKRKDWDRKALGEAAGFLLWFFVPFLGFSLIRTKLIWYCYPCTVPLFLAAAIFLGRFLRLPMAEQNISRWKSELTAAGLWIAAAGSVFLTAYFMRDTYLTVIRGAHGDSFQMFIQESVERDSDYAGSRAYVCVQTEDPEDTGSWDQNMLFLAEISGDFHCEDGGMDAFLQESEPAVLYLTQEQYEQNAVELEETQVLYQRDGYMLVGRN